MREIALPGFLWSYTPQGLPRALSLQAGWYKSMYILSGLFSILVLTPAQILFLAWVLINRHDSVGLRDATRYPYLDHALFPWAVCWSLCDGAGSHTGGKLVTFYSMGLGLTLSSLPNLWHCLWDCLGNLRVSSPPTIFANRLVQWWGQPAPMLCLEFSFRIG